MKCPKCQFENPGGTKFASIVETSWNCLALNVASLIRQLLPEFCSYSSLKNRKPSGEPVL